MFDQHKQAYMAGVNLAKEFQEQADAIWRETFEGDNPYRDAFFVGIRDLLNGEFFG